jgi:hypothetical protein
LVRPKPHLGKKWSEETKQKISEGRKGKCVGSDNPFFGKKHSEETIKHLRKINQGKEPPNKKSFSSEQIKQIVLDSRSLRKVAKDWNVSTTVIRRLKDLMRINVRDNCTRWEPDNDSSISGFYARPDSEAR